jgi:hypothetical protein
VRGQHIKLGKKRTLTSLVSANIYICKVDRTLIYARKDTLTNYFSASLTKLGEWAQNRLGEGHTRLGGTLIS